MARSIHVVGLGSGDPDKLTLGVYKTLREAGRVFVRTNVHPVVRLLDAEKIAYTSFDDIYLKHDSFPEVYKEISDVLIEQALNADEPVVYAVPGHPMVAETTVQLLRETCARRGIPFSVSGGESFLDEAFLRFGFDPIDGMQLLDAQTMNRSMLAPALHTIIAQVYDKSVASDVKLTLMELYPDDYPVTIGHELGVAGKEKILTVPLFELDRQEGFGNLSLVWVPRTDDERIVGRTFARLQEVVRILRSPEGCPWDREQTHRSIRKNLIEETYEVLETIDDDDAAAMCEELGDLLLQVLLHAQMEAEAGSFDIWDVVQALHDKLIRRHPHVFGDRTAQNAAEALSTWQEMKAKEKAQAGAERPASVLAGVPRDLPGILYAWKLQKKAAKVGFDWERAEQVADKVREELAELMAVGEGRELQDERKDELGDLLFAVVNLARFFDIDPEEAISLANRKFMRRFSYIEEQLRLNKKDIVNTGLVEMEQLWQQAKRENH
ncbi:MAG TPA: nucleoside triphosphate pyrophosphohydrolase [Bacilli bacterium]